MRIKSIVIIVALLALSSCSVIAPVVFGLREIDGYNAEQCAKFYKKLPNDFAFTSLVCDEEPLGSKVEVYLINNDIPLSKLVSETE
ncbi:MAG: hypothetical protein IJ057_02470 [Bacteroidales bacterium]|nr:hypothetical protein [Bacteroidales bacterium]